MLDALIWIDVKVFWLITLGNVRPGETMSAAAWDLERSGKWQGKLMRPLIDSMFAIVQKNHCQQAWEWQRHLYETPTIERALRDIGLALNATHGTIATDMPEVEITATNWRVDHTHEMAQLAVLAKALGIVNSDTGL